jgi:phage shock protein B
MMEDILVPIAVCGVLFIGMPWIILHYITKWKQAPSLTGEDEKLLDELHNMARRLDERMETIERIVAADNPDFRPSVRPVDTESQYDFRRN